MDAANVLTLAQKELRDSLRNRWFLLYAVAFSVLALALSYLSLAGAARVGGFRSSPGTASWSGTSNWPLTSIFCTTISRGSPMATC